MKFEPEEIVESLVNGQFKQAKEQLQRGCKTHPEKQAFRLGIVIMILHRPHPEWNRDLAYRFLNMFEEA